MAERISSRTPEGDSERCPVCGHIAIVELSSFPLTDATCPACGSWLHESLCHYETKGIHERSFPQRWQNASVSEEIPSAIERGEVPQTMWVCASIGSSLLVADADHSAWRGIIWFAILMLFARCILPSLARQSISTIQRHDNFWLGAALGWAIVVGFPVGMCFGVLLAWVYEWPGSAMMWGLVGLVIGPIGAALEGLVVAAIVVGVCLLVTGRNIVKT